MITYLTVFSWSHICRPTIWKNPQKYREPVTAIMSAKSISNLVRAMACDTFLSPCTVSNISMSICPALVSRADHAVLLMRCVFFCLLGDATKQVWCQDVWRDDIRFDSDYSTLGHYQGSRAPKSATADAHQTLPCVRTCSQERRYSDRWYSELPRIGIAQFRIIGRLGVCPQSARFGPFSHSRTTSPPLLSRTFAFTYTIPLFFQPLQPTFLASESLCQWRKQLPAEIPAA